MKKIFYLLSVALPLSVCAQNAELESNDLKFQTGFTFWSFAQAGKEFSTKNQPFVTTSQLSVNIALENKKYYSYLLYTFADNSVSCWTGYKFHQEKWDTYVILTQSLRGDGLYAGIGIEHNWTIGPITMPYFVEGGFNDKNFSVSTGFLISIQHVWEKKSKTK